MIAHARPDALMRRHSLADDGPGHLRDWLRRRLTHLFENDVSAGDVELVVARLEGGFRGQPFSIAFAVARLIAKSWCMTRRMSRAPAGFVFGCCAAEGDDMRHYLACPRLAASQCGRRPPPWVWAYVRAACVWAYVACRMHIALRHAGTPMAHSAPCRRLSARSPRARPLAGMLCSICIALAAIVHYVPHANDSPRQVWQGFVFATPELGKHVCSCRLLRCAPFDHVGAALSASRFLFLLSLFKQKTISREMSRCSRGFSCAPGSRIPPELWRPR